MRLAAVVQPQTDDTLRLLAQLGVEDWVYYDMAGMPEDPDGLRRERDRAERFGLRLSVVEGGPRIDRIVLGLDGRDAQIEQYKRSLEQMGRLGIRTLCYNFMPQVLDDAMVVRTSTTARERGGALTSSFDVSVLDRDAWTEAGETTDEMMWDNLEYFLQRVVPVAEAAEVNLAMHPDDPPLSPIWHLSRIMRSREAFDRLFSIAPSPVNGLTFCQGCFAELGEDLPGLVRHFGSRIHFVHLRDVAGSPLNFRETFPDNGPTDMRAVFEAYREIGYAGMIRSDHVPQLVGEEGANDGYGLRGNLFAIGYIRGMLEAVFGRDAGS